MPREYLFVTVGTVLIIFGWLLNWALWETFKMKFSYKPKFKKLNLIQKSILIIPYGYTILVTATTIKSKLLH